MSIGLALLVIGIIVFLAVNHLLGLVLVIAAIAFLVAGR